MKDADAVWGLGNAETLNKIREEVGDDKARIASIGPAGERMVLFANVMNELAHANGRCGMGAVMGSKHLKAVACRGDANHLEFADAENVKKLVSWHNQRIKEHLPNQNMRKYGTPMFVVGLNKAGILPTRNWRESVFEGAEKIGVPGYEKILKRHATSYRCAVGCKRVVETAEPYHVNPRYGGPEYETLAAFGSLCGIDDLGAVAKANELCNQAGRYSKFYEYLARPLNYNILRSYTKKLIFLGASQKSGSPKRTIFIRTFGSIALRPVSSLQ